jgi:hypothetical protein
MKSSSTPVVIPFWLRPVSCKEELVDPSDLISGRRYVSRDTTRSVDGNVFIFVFASGSWSMESRHLISELQTTSPKMWTMADALELIRMLQPHIMEAGYYLALAGGVLNNGSSNNDLDLVAVPRSPSSMLESVAGCLDTYLTWTGVIHHVQSAKVMQYTYLGAFIDIAVIN